MSNLIASAACAGFFSWCFLKHYTIDGDHGLIALATGVTSLYFFIRSTHGKQAIFETIKVTAAYVVSLTASTLIYRLSPYHPLSAYPGPIMWRTSNLFLTAISYGGHRHLILDRMHRQYGKIIRIGPNVLSVNSMSAFNIIYGSGHHMEKSDSYRLPGKVKSVSLFFRTKRQDHMDRKNIWLRAFSASGMENFYPVLESSVWDLTRCIEDRTRADGTVNLMECIFHWSYDFMGKMVFGGNGGLNLMEKGDPRGLIHSGKKAMHLVDSFGQSPWLFDILWHLPSSGSLHQLRDLAASLMRARATVTGVKIRDLASYLLEGDTRTGKIISLSDLEIESIVAIQGGSDNTGTTIGLAIYFMLSYPQTYKRLQEELERTFPDPTSALDRTLLTKVPFLEAILSEALRLASPFFLPRIVPTGGVSIEGNMIPKNTTVALAAYSQQISEDNFFPDPLMFRPERWLPGGLGPGSVLNKAASFSFSYGPYACVAKSFAMHEMRMCLSRLVLTFDMELPSDFDVKNFCNGIRTMRTTFLDVPLIVKGKRREGRDMPLAG
ncbi:cytochrome P450 [Mycena floridula]|nr:cytochrome P450 [Mycena floridula]